MVFVKALKEQPKRILIVIPEWKERKFLISTLQFMLTLFLYLTMLMLSLLEMISLLHLKGFA